MSVTTSETGTLGLHALEEYAPLIGAAAVERILRKAERLRTLHAIHISSTFYGGGVTELGSRAKQTVCEKFLMSRLLEDWVELLGDVQAGRR